MSKYYDLDIILNKKDLDKETPAIFIITTNRSAGKTTSVLKRFLENFYESKKQFILLYRHQYELSSANTIFTDVLKLYYTRVNADGEKEIPKIDIVKHSKGLFIQLFIDEEPFGFALALSNPDVLKKYSPLFADVDEVLMDEFQTESGKYLKNEVEKLESVMTTIARGGGEQSREIKLFLLGNMVSIMNPYFIRFGIHNRLRDNTNFLRGNGWIAEFGFNESASKAILTNKLFKAFGESRYMKYSTEKVYLSDSSAFIEKPTGRFKYIFTMIHDGHKFGIREFYDEGIVYVSNKIDNSCKNIITFKARDHSSNTVMLNHFSYLWKNIKDAYQNGYLRFDDLKSKVAVFDVLSVDLFK